MIDKKDINWTQNGHSRTFLISNDFIVAYVFQMCYQQKTYIDDSIWRLKQLYLGMYLLTYLLM